MLFYFVEGFFCQNFKVKKSSLKTGKQIYNMANIKRLVNQAYMLIKIISDQVCDCIYL